MKNLLLCVLICAGIVTAPSVCQAHGYRYNHWHNHGPYVHIHPHNGYHYHSYFNYNYVRPQYFYRTYGNPVHNHYRNNAINSGFFRHYNYRIGTSNGTVNYFRQR